MKSAELTAWLGGLEGILPVAQREFNLSSLLEPRETQLNRLLGEILDPEGSHGLKDAPLRALLTRIGHPAALESGILSARVYVNASVRGSRGTSRFVDVTIEMRSGTPSLIHIENKPWAGEQADQLEDYALDALRRANGWLVYLPARSEAYGGWPPTSLKSATKEKLGARFCVVPYADEPTGLGVISLVFDGPVNAEFTLPS